MGFQEFRLVNLFGRFPQIQGFRTSFIYIFSWSFSDIVLGLFLGSSFYDYEEINIILSFHFSMDKKKDSLRGFHLIPRVLEKPLRDSKLMDTRGTKMKPLWLLPKNCLHIQVGIRLKGPYILTRGLKLEEWLDWGSHNWTTLCTNYMKIFLCFHSSTWSGSYVISTISRILN